MEIEVGMKGKIIKECFICHEGTDIGNGIVTGDEQWINEGAFKVIEVHPEFITVLFKGDKTKWNIINDDYENINLIK